MKMLEIFFWLGIIAVVLTFFKDAIFNFGQSQPILSTCVVMVVAGLAWWFLVVKGPKPKSDAIQSPPISQSATASGGSTIIQINGNVTVINPGATPEATRKDLSATVANRNINKKLARKYPLGYVLLGVANGTVVFQPESSLLLFDPENLLTIQIDESSNLVSVILVYFRIYTKKWPTGFVWGAIHFTTPYAEGVPTRFPLPFNIENVPIQPYLEVLDKEKKYFVLGFKRED